MKKTITITMLLLTALSVQIFAATPKSDTKLFTQFTNLDNLIFEESFNKCNVEVLPQLVAADFEFYHDVGGVQNKEEFLKAVQQNICANPNHKPMRKLVPGSMEIFSLKKDGILYGVIQRGVHEFYIKEKDKKAYKTGIAKFTHLWLLNDEKWQLKRVLSFDHQASSD